MTLREATRAFAVSRATLAKALEDGTVSGTRDDAGHWRLEPAELARLYRPRPAPQATVSRPNVAQATRPRPAGEPPAQSAAEATEMAVRLARAEAALEAERQKVAILQRHLDDVRRMLPPPAPAAPPAPEAPAPPRRRWWPW